MSGGDIELSSSAGAGAARAILGAQLAWRHTHDRCDDLVMSHRACIVPLRLTQTIPAEG